GLKFCFGIQLLSRLDATDRDEESFIVRTPENAVVGIVGGQVVLDCQLVPAELPANVEVRWNRLKLGEPVHLYREGKDQPTLQDLSYAHRTELYKSQFRNGNVSLLIKQLTVQDEGVYSCQVASGQERKDNKVMLKIAAVGLNPVIQLTGHRGSMVELGCTSKGWYPEPKVMWLD
uniref:Ig-like domain-containing protein n=1 Tax=Callorhinchus milii TaxID=7868 RepID=A0A4W3JJ90_CALMI